MTNFSNEIEFIKSIEDFNDYQIDTNDNIIYKQIQSLFPDTEKIKEYIKLVIDSAIQEKIEFSNIHAYLCSVVIQLFKDNKIDSNLYYKTFCDYGIFDYKDQEKIQSVMNAGYSATQIIKDDNDLLTNFIIDLSKNTSKINNELSNNNSFYNITTASCDYYFMNVESDNELDTTKISKLISELIKKIIKDPEINNTKTNETSFIIQNIIYGLTESCLINNHNVSIVQLIIKDIISEELFNEENKELFNEENKEFISSIINGFCNACIDYEISAYDLEKKISSLIYQNKDYAKQITEGFVKSCITHDYFEYYNKSYDLDKQSEKKTNYKDTELMVAYRNGDIDNIKDLITNGKIDVTAKNINGQTEFMLICSLGNKDLINLYLENNNVLINEQDNKGKTAFMYSCETGRLDVIKALVEQQKLDLDINIQDNDGNTALMYLCENAMDENVVKYALSLNDIELDKENNLGSTAFTFIGINGNFSEQFKEKFKAENENIKKFTISRDHGKNIFYTGLNKSGTEINTVDKLINNPDLMSRTNIVSITLDDYKESYDNLINILHVTFDQVLNELKKMDDSNEIRYIQLNVENSENKEGHSLSFAISKDAIFVMDSSYETYTIGLYSEILYKALKKINYPQLYYIGSYMQSDGVSCRNYSSNMILDTDMYLKKHKKSLIDLLNDETEFFEHPDEEKLKKDYWDNSENDHYTKLFVNQHKAVGIPNYSAYLVQKSLQRLDNELSDQAKHIVTIRNTTTIDHINENAKFDVNINKTINNTTNKERSESIQKILNSDVEEYDDKDYFKKKLKKYNKDYKSYKHNCGRIQQIKKGMYYLNLGEKEIIFKKKENNKLKIRYRKKNISIHFNDKINIHGSHDYYKPNSEFIINIINDTELCLQNKDKIEIIQTFYKTLKREIDGFDSKYFIEDFKDIKIENFELNEEILKQWDEEIEKEKQQPEQPEPIVEEIEEKQAINSDKFKKGKQEEQSIFKYSKDKDSIYLTETTKQTLKQNGITNEEIQTISNFLQDLYTENPNSFELKNIQQNGFNMNSKLTINLDKEKIKKINKCLGFNKQQTVGIGSK